MSARPTSTLIFTAALVLSLACSDDSDEGPSEGELHLLTYNVAGLPQGNSGSNPEKYIPLISPMLNAFDLVLVQEDFYYHKELSKDVTLPHKSVHQDKGKVTVFGDGLNRFSRFPWSDFKRVPYTKCEGADCGATKGTSVALTKLAQGVEVDIYNTHLEAGSGPKDNEARENGVDILLATIKARSTGRAIIVAGDFNLKYKDGGHDVKMLNRLTGAGLKQVCVTLKCTDDRVDRIFYRDSASLTWIPRARTIEKSFVDSAGKDLSDHEALSARLGWKKKKG